MRTGPRADPCTHLRLTSQDRTDGARRQRGTDLLRADLTGAALRVAVNGFAALWRGRAPRLADLLGHDDGTGPVIDELVQRGRAEIDGHGRLIGIHGLTLRSTRHRFDHAGRSHHTWCAFDSIGIPAALGLEATARTDCPTCRQPLTVALHDGVPAGDGLVLWLPSTSGEHLMADFCAAADLYCCVEHLHQRRDTARAPGTVIDLARAAAIGSEAWADVRAIPLDPATD